MKINLLLLIPSLEVAGAEKVCCTICDNLDFEKFDVTLISISNNIPLWETVKHKDKIRFYTCNEPERLRFPWFSMKVLRQLYKLYKLIKPDIVHSHLWGVKCIYLYSFLIIKNKPAFIATIHSSEFIYTSKKLSSLIFKCIENFIYKLLNFHLIAISKAVDKMIRKKLHFNTITYIENGIDTDLFSPEKRAKYEQFKHDYYKNNYPILVHVGRASDTKRQIDIINALKILRDDYPNIKLLLIGKDNDLAYGEQIKKINLENNVDFISPNNEVVKYLSIADIGVFPSLFEGLSLAFAEMMSCGLPLVISDIPSLTEMTNDDEAALVVPIKSPENIANNVRLFIEDKKLAETKGANARKLAIEKYSIHVMIKKHSDLYKSILK